MGLDRLECEDAGGEHKGTSWIDCETPRDPSVGQFFKTACPGCNGQRDCFCEGDEKCVNQNCQPCGDHVFPVAAGQKVFTGLAVEPGDLVDVYVRSCRDDVVLDDADREVRLSLNDADETFLSLVQQEATDIPVIKAGELVLSDSPADIIVCITIHPAVTGACCFFDDLTQAHACTDNVTAEWCSGKTDGVFYEGQECAEINCPEGAWFVDCFQNCSDETPGLCDNCSAGPFASFDEANDYVLANQPPPYCCDFTIVEVTRRGNPLP